jgi:hypothetical protein
MAAILSRLLLVSGLLLHGGDKLAEAPALQIQVIKGNGANNNAVAMTSATTIVRVTSTRGEIVPDALVVFAGPDVGPSVNFGGDGPTAQCITDESGLAVAPHIRATGGNGPVLIKVLATKSGATASASIYQMNLGVNDGNAPAEFMEITVLSSPSSLDGKSASSRIVRIRVSDASGRPVRGATVEIQRRRPDSASRRSEDAVLLEGVTDASGGFAASISYRKGRAPREYLIKASLNGLSASRYLSVGQ